MIEFGGDFGDADLRTLRNGGHIMMMRMNLTVVLLSATLLGAGCDLYGIGDPSSDATEFRATLSGGAERPDLVDTEATGSGTFSLNDDETQLTYSISATGFSEDVTAAHFHFSADGASGSGEIVFPITGSVVNDGEGGVTAEGVWSLTEADLRNLRLDYIYVNFHTATNPAGEIRGNLVPAS